MAYPEIRLADLPAPTPLARRDATPWLVLAALLAGIALLVIAHRRRRRRKGGGDG